MSGAQELDLIYAKVSRRVISLLLVGYIVAYLDRVNVGFAKLQMLADLQISASIYGLGAGIFFIGYFLFEVPSNLILHRVGARRWIARIMISWGVVSAATAFINTEGAFLTLRFLLGIAEAGFFPGVILYLTHWYPPERRGKVIALLMAGVPICSVLGSLVSGWIMQGMNGRWGWLGWRWLFLLEALPAVLLGIVILFWLTNDIASASWLSSREKSLLIAELERCPRVKNVESSFTSALRDARVWFGCLIYFSLATGLYAVGFWLPSIIADLGVRSPATIGAIAAIPYAFAAVGMVAMGRSADRHQERRWHIAVPAVAAALGLTGSVWLSGNAVATVAALTLACFGILTALPLFWTLPTTYLRASAAAGGIAIINSFGNLGGFLGPNILGWTKALTGSNAVGMYIVASLVLLGAVLVAAGLGGSRAHVHPTATDRQR